MADRGPALTEELRAESPRGVRGTNENIWHIASAERWADGRLIGHRTGCGRNYAEAVEQHDLAGLGEVCSDCIAQVARPH